MNDQFSRTSFMTTIILVALLTYLTMFNVNSLVHLCGSLYNTKKKNIVRAMKVDGNDKWKQRGKRFEVFRPKHEHPQPSEWYISLYSFLRPLAILGIGFNSNNDSLAARNDDGDRQSPLGLARISDLFRRRRTKPEEPERPEEGWVL